MVPLRAFVETPAGSRLKQIHDEDSLLPVRSMSLSAPYPFAYGFLIDHLGGDGECVDCYVISARPIAAGRVLDCELLGLVEQWENGAEDHKMLVRPLGDVVEVDADTGARISEFIRAVFRSGRIGYVEVGRTLDADAAGEWLARQATRDGPVLD